RHLKEALSERVRSSRRKSEDIPVSSVGASLQERVFDRLQKLERNLRRVISQHTEARHQVVLSLKIRKCFCEQRPFARRQFAVRQAKKFRLELVVTLSAIREQTCKDITVLVVGDKLLREELLIGVDEGEEHFVRAVAAQLCHGSDPLLADLRHRASVRFRQFQKQIH